jgi:hypothetical protein
MTLRRHTGIVAAPPVLFPLLADVLCAGWLSGLTVVVFIMDLFQLVVDGNGSTLRSRDCWARFIHAHVMLRA